MIVNVVEGLVGDVAVADHYGGHACFGGGVANIDYVLAPDGGLVVGEGNRGAAVFAGERRNVFGRKMAGMELIGAGFDGIPTGKP